MISGIIIAKNSEELIAKAINNLSFCSEIIVVDGGSIDETCEIAQKNGAKVIKGDNSDFSKQRMIGMEHATGDYVFYMDTDELTSDELKEEILKIDKKNEIFSAYYIKRQNYYLGNHKWPTIEKLQRLFRRKDFIKWSGRLHETPIFKGEVGNLNGYLLHFTHRDLNSMLNKTIVWSDVEAKLRLDSKHPKVTWWRFFRVMLTGFYKSYIKERGFLSGTAGIVESIYQGFSMFVTYAKLWEMQNKNK